MSYSRCRLCYKSHFPEFHDTLKDLTPMQDVLVQFADLLQGYAKRHDGKVTTEYIDEVLQLVLSAGKIEVEVKTK